MMASAFWKSKDSWDSRRMFLVKTCNGKTAPKSLSVAIINILKKYLMSFIELKF